ncbi:17865_t:CDS:2 [Dentiscutata erythropus]|uniref:17865_t:CDS:1 n=1 Tax=Dentiscutata erythropus TaxID=1348616 RepID=A0A9N9H417_9GLOM|nr:17865_t:CDS:2 [Dentiscutata erythropus]
MLEPSLAGTVTRGGVASIVSLITLAGVVIHHIGSFAING